MIYFLMHENDKLAIMDYDNQVINGIIINDRMIDRLPFLDRTSKTKEEGLAAWIMNRGIPVTRQQIENDLKGIRRLVKGNYNNTCRQSLCEVLATEIHKRQERFEYTPYSLIQISADGHEVTGCECPNFININTEFVSAIEILNSIRKSNEDNYYETLKIRVNSFKKYEVELLRYVNTPMLVDINKLPLVEEARELFLKDKSCNEETACAWSKAYNTKINFLQELQKVVKVYSYNYLKSRGITLRS